MVAVPIGYDQPGTAARIAHHGTGEFIELVELTTKRLRRLIEKVLQHPNYRKRADYFQKVISKADNATVAEVALSLGYESEAAFNRAVKRGTTKTLKEPT
jgi:zeaxanthin glucosyltransferase